MRSMLPSAAREPGLNPSSLDLGPADRQASRHSACRQDFPDGCQRSRYRSRCWRAGHPLISHRASRDACRPDGVFARDARGVGDQRASARLDLRRDNACASRRTRRRPANLLLAVRDLPYYESKPSVEGPLCGEPARWRTTKTISARAGHRMGPAGTHHKVAVFEDGPVFSMPRLAVGGRNVTLDYCAGPGQKRARLRAIKNALCSVIAGAGMNAT